MTNRTTFSLDDQTVGRLRRLSKRWNVSQAEVVRRALEAAETMVSPGNPLDELRKYHQNGGLSEDQAKRYLADWVAERDAWGRE